MEIYMVYDRYEGYSVRVEATSRNQAKMRGAQAMDLDYIDVNAVLGEDCTCPRCGRQQVKPRGKPDTYCYECYWIDE